ncbi:MAG: 23S rRNA (guanosine(2251)-2'-O)-methyltransferase RlmB [Thermodesulfobacteriota bacterium]
MQKTNWEILYGLHPVQEALKAGRRAISEIYIAANAPHHRLEPVRELADAKGVPLRTLSAEALRKKSGSDKHQGVAALAGSFPLTDEDEIVHGYLQHPREHFLLLIDSVQDPHNLGALIRSAVCLGAAGVVIPKDRAAAPTPSVSKASAGAMEHALLARVTNLVDFMRLLRQNAIWLIGADARAESSIFRWDLKGPLALIVGGEDKGLRPLVRKHCDQLVAIPQMGAVNSLNASVAGAILMYEALRHRFQERPSGKQQ